MALGVVEAGQRVGAAAVVAATVVLVLVLVVVTVVRIVVVTVGTAVVGVTGPVRRVGHVARYPPLSAQLARRESQQWSPAQLAVDTALHISGFSGGQARRPPAVLQQFQPLVAMLHVVLSRQRMVNETFDVAHAPAGAGADELAQRDTASTPPLLAQFVDTQSQQL